MFEMKILNEVHGTVTEIFEQQDGTKGIIIKPDDIEEGMITDSTIGIDYSQFCVGERVVYVTYSWKRPATKSERIINSQKHKSIIDEVEESEYIIYDELFYDQKKQSEKTR